jgi:hypothetical protein
LALKHVVEVVNTGDTGDQFQIKGGIPHLCRKKASGCQSSAADHRCCRAAPTWSAEASTIIANSWSCCGCAGNAAAPKVALAASKAVTISDVHSTAAVALGLPRVESVRGGRILAAAGTNRL